MAARNPTSYVDLSAARYLRARYPIRASYYNDLLNNQVFILDQAQTALIWCGVQHQPFGAAAFTDQRKFKIRIKDMCGVSTVSNDEIQCAWAAYVSRTAVAADVPANMQVRLSSTLATADTSSALTIPDTGTPAWVGYDSFNVKTNGNEDTLTLALQPDTSASVYVFAFALWASET